MGNIRRRRVCIWVLTFLVGVTFVAPTVSAKGRKRARNAGFELPVKPTTKPDGSDNINCVGQWGPWSQCGSTCGECVVRRSFIVQTPAQGGGEPCKHEQGQRQGLVRKQPECTASQKPSNQTNSETLPQNKTNIFAEVKPGGTVTEANGDTAATNALPIEKENNPTTSNPLHRQPKRKKDAFDPNHFKLTDLKNLDPDSKHFHAAIANWAVVVVGVLLSSMLVVVGVASICSSRSQGRLQKANEQEALLERARLVAVDIRLKTQLSCDFLPIIQRVKSWFDAMSTDERLSAFRREADAGNVGKRVEAMLTEARNIWEDIPTVMQEKFGCGVDKTIHDNVAVVVTFTSSFDTNENVKTRLTRDLSSSIVKHAVVQEALQAHADAATERNTATELLCEQAALFAFRGLADASVKLQTTLSAAAASSTQTSSDTNRRSHASQELSDSLRGILDDNMVEHFALWPRTSVTELHSALLALLLPPKGSTSRHRTRDIKDIVELVRAQRRKDAHFNGEQMWSLAKSGLQYLTYLEGYIQRLQSHLHVPEGRHNSRLMLQNSDDVSEISERRQQVRAQVSSAGKSQEALTLINQTVTDITQRIEGEFSFQRLRAYQTFLEDMADDEAITKFPDDPHRQQELRQNRQQLFLKQVLAATLRRHCFVDFVVFFVMSAVPCVSCCEGRYQPCQSQDVPQKRTNARARAKQAEDSRGCPQGACSTAQRICCRGRKSR